MPLSATLLVVATLLPLASFAVLLFFGRRMGNPFAGYVGTAAIALSFACSAGATIAWLSGGQFSAGNMPYGANFPWVPVGTSAGQEHAGYLDIGIYVDSLTVSMFSMVTFVAT